MDKYQFGFGCMRLPLLDKEDNTSFDYPLIESLFDAYLKAGFTYFDTAYTYHGYHAEEAMRKALVERHPRDSFELASKFPLRDFKDEADLEVIFNRQLFNCGVDYSITTSFITSGPTSMKRPKNAGSLTMSKERRPRGRLGIWDSPSTIPRACLRTY